MIVGSVLVVLFVAVIALSWVWYRRYRSAKNLSDPNSTKKSGYRNVAKLSASLSSSVSSIFGKSSSRELGLSVKPDKDMRGTSRIGVNPNSSSNLNTCGSSSNYSLHGHKISNQMDTLRNGQRNIVVSSTLYPNVASRGFLEGSHSNLASSSKTSLSARALVNGSQGKINLQAGSSELLRSGSTRMNEFDKNVESSRGGLEGSHRNLASSSNTALSARALGTGIQGKLHPPAGSSELLRSGSTRMNEFDNLKSNGSSSTKVLTPKSISRISAPTQVLIRTASQQTLGDPRK